MSHFSVLVITPDRPSDLALAAILQPWHEFECTGTDDQYVVDVDKTAEMREEYEKDTSTRVKGPDGTLHSFFDDEGNWRKEFSKPDPETYDPNRRSRFVPPGYEEVEVPTKQVMTFREYVAYQTSKDKEVTENEVMDMTKRHRFGHTLIGDDGEVIRVIDRTNPNKKWDWWVVGGRYTGKFQPNYDPDEDPANLKTCWLCDGTGKRNDMLGVQERARNPAYTCNGCNGTGRMAVFPTERKKVESDQIQIKDIPLDALRTEKEQKAARLYDKFHRIVAGRPVESWMAVRERHGDDNIDAARKEYHDNPVIKELKKEDEFSWEIDEKLFTLTRDEYLSRARANAISCFALVKDGQWYERGRMGWFACVADEKDEEQWTREVASLIDELPPTTWITVVDCHI